MAIARLFNVVDVVDAELDRRRQNGGCLTYPQRGIVDCRNCDGRVVFVQLTDIKGAARCSGTCGVDFAPLAPVRVE